MRNFERQADLFVFTLFDTAPPPYLHIQTK